MNKTEIFKDYSDFYYREDKRVNGVSQEFANENLDYQNENSTNGFELGDVAVPECSIELQMF